MAAGAGGKEVGRISIRVVPNLDDFRDEIRREIEEVERTEQANIRVNLIVDRDALDRIRDTRIEIDAQVNTDDLNVSADFDSSDLARQIREYQASLRDIRVDVEANVDVDTGAATAKLIAWAATMREVTTIRARIVLGGLTSALRTTVEGVTTAFKKLGDALSTLGIRGENLGILVAALALISPALALASGALVTLPAALAGIAVPIGAIALGFEGIKKAAEAARPAFDDLRKNVSAVFEEGMKPGFELLNNRIIPALTGSFQSVAGGLSEAFSTVIASLGSQQGLGNLQTIIDNVGESLRRAAPGLKSFTDGLLELTGRLSEKFPGLADAFNRTGASFLEWVDEFTTKDPVTQVSQLDTAMKNLGDTLSPIGGIFTDLFKDGIANLTDGDFAASMQSFVDSIRELISETLPAAAGAFQTLAGVLEPIAATLETIVDLADFAVPGDAKLLESPGAGTIPDGVPIIGAWDDILAELLPQSEEAAAEQGRKIGLALRDGIKESIDAGLGIGTEALFPADAGAAVSEQIKQAVAVSAEDQKQALRSVFTPGQVDAAVSQQITNQVTAAIQGAKQALLALGPELQGQIDAALIPLATIADRVGEAFSNIGPIVQSALGGAIQAATTAGNEIVNGIRGALFPLPNVVAAAFAPLATAVTTAMTGAVTASQKGGTDIVAELQSWPGRFASALGDLSGVLVPAGQQLASGLRAGLEAGMQDVLAYASTIAGQIAAVKGPLPKDRKELVPAGEALMEGLGNGMDTGFQDVLTQTKAMAKAIFEAMKEVFGDASGANFNFNFGGASAALNEVNTSAQGLQKTLGSTGLTTTGTGKLDSATKQQIDALKLEKDKLQLQRQQLQVEKGMATDKATKAAIQQKQDELDLQKQALSLQIEQLEYSGKYEQQTAGIAGNYTEMAKKAGQMPLDFAKATIGQFQQDIGISGDGALGAVADWGIQAASNFVFNVSNIDEAIAVKNNQQNKQALSYT